MRNSWLNLRTLTTSPIIYSLYYIQRSDGCFQFESNSYSLKTPEPAFSFSPFSNLSLLMLCLGRGGGGGGEL